jgi:hypothetical protein
MLPIGIKYTGGAKISPYPTKIQGYIKGVNVVAM